MYIHTLTLTILSWICENEMSGSRGLGAEKGAQNDMIRHDMVYSVRMYST